MKDALHALEELAPLRFAEAWDKVGLLVEGRRSTKVQRIFLCIDLTEAVLAEAKAARAQLIVAYHPPIFEPISRLTRDREKARIVMDCLAAGMAVYSPHTALDAAPGGVNDWLASAFPKAGARPIQVREEHPAGQDAKLVTYLPEADLEQVAGALAEAGAGIIGEYKNCSFRLKGQGTFQGSARSRPKIGRKQRLETVDEVRLEMVCRLADAGPIGEVLRRHHPYEEPAWELYPLAPRAVPGTGQGRHLKLAKPMTLDAVTRRMKKHLGLRRLRCAATSAHQEGAPIETIALCAGAGGSVLEGVDADLYLTGEMRHHDALAALARGKSVLLGEHSNTERGFLPVLAGRLESRLEGVTALVSKVDRDPFEVV